MSNSITKIIKKIERRLGTNQLNLPDELSKDVWAEIISEDSLTTFSRFFPRKFTIMLLPTTPRTDDGYYIIDDCIPEGMEFLGIKDINWSLFGADGSRIQQMQGYGVYDVLSNGYGVDDIMLAQARADLTSIYNNGLYLDVVQPNKVRLTSVTGSEIYKNMSHIPVDIIVKHADNLMTISPTMMETFEKLAIADVAGFLYENLKYYDEMPNAYINLDLKLSKLESEASKREDIVNYLSETYVSSANDAQPIMITI